MPNRYQRRHGQNPAQQGLNRKNELISAMNQGRANGIKFASISLEALAILILKNKLNLDDDSIASFLADFTGVADGYLDGEYSNLSDFLDKARDDLGYDEMLTDNEIGEFDVSLKGHMRNPGIKYVPEIQIADKTITKSNADVTAGESYAIEPNKTQD